MQQNQWTAIQPTNLQHTLTVEDYQELVTNHLARWGCPTCIVTRAGCLASLRLGMTPKQAARAYYNQTMEVRRVAAGIRAVH